MEGESEHPSLPLAQRSVFARCWQAESCPAERHTFLVLFGVKREHLSATSSSSPLFHMEQFHFSTAAVGMRTVYSMGPLAWRESSSLRLIL